MSIDLIRSLTGINEYGGSYWAYKKIDSDGTDKSSPDTWHNATYRGKTTYEYSTPLKDITDESGEIIKQQADAKKVGIKLTSKQNDAHTLSWLKEETQGEYFAIYMEYESPTKSDYQADLFIPLCQIESSFNVSKPGTELEINIKPLANPTAVELSLSAVPLSAWSVNTSNITCSASKYFVFNY